MAGPEPATFMAYFRQWFKAAFAPAWDVFGWLGVVVGAVLWAAHKYFPNQFTATTSAIGITPEAAMSDLVWQVPLSAGAVVLLYRFIRAPYELHIASASVHAGIAASLEEKIASLQTEITDLKALQERRVGARDWLDLAESFRSINGFGVQAQWIERDRVERWGGLHGGPADVRACAPFCQLAGEMLMRSPRVEASLSERVRKQSTAENRWFAFLSDSGDISHFGEIESSGTGFAQGISNWGFIENVPVKSANKCVECAALET